MTRICAGSECTRPVEKREWCNKHYRRWLTHGDANFTLRRRDEGNAIARWHAKISQRADGCWIWLGTKNKYGYGVHSTDGGGREFAHRFGYELLRAPIGEGLQIDHLCRVRDCVNPDHLEPVTAKTNLQRAAPYTKKAQQTHCAHGHEFNEANTIARGTRRQCRECQRTAVRNAMRRRRALAASTS